METTCSYDGTKLTSIKKPTLSGIVADKYEIIASIGGGGWGTVYKARHTLLDRIVAVKTLHPHMVASGSALKRFKQEAQAGSQLDHPHILNVLDFGITDDGIPYLVMDYLEGQSLGDLLQGNKNLQPARGLAIFVQVASALAHAHRRGVIHRDLKPANVMLIEHDDNPDYVKIVDFGIAKILKRGDGADSTELTETGQLFGSPLYMSPEQCTGKDLDGRSDIYSLGCVIYRSLTGLPPFEVQDLATCIYKHVNELPVPFGIACPELELRPELESLVFKAMAKDPAERFQSMSELEEAIKTLMHADRLTPSASQTGMTTVGKPEDPALAATSTGSGSGSGSLEDTVPPNNPGIISGTTRTISAEQPAGKPELQKTTAEVTSSPVVSNTLAPSNTVPLPPAGQKATSSELAPVERIQSLLTTPIIVVPSILVLLSLAWFSYSYSHPSTPATPPNKVAPQPAPTAEHPSTPEMAQGIALYDRGDFQGAYNYFVDLIKRYGKDAPHDSVLWEGMSLVAQNKPHEAKALLLQYQPHADNSADTVRDYNALAIACVDLNEQDVAAGYLNRAMDLKKHLKGLDQREYANTLRGLGLIALRNKKYSNAETYLQEALSVNQQNKGRAVDRAYILFDLGQAHQDLKENGAARECYNSALALVRQYGQPDSLAMANCLMCIASLDFAEKKYAQAETGFQQALTIERQVLGESHRNVAELEYCLGVSRYSLGKTTQAADVLKQSLQTRQQLLGPSDPDTVRTKRALDAAQHVTRKQTSSNNDFSRWEQLQRKLGRHWK